MFPGVFPLPKAVTVHGKCSTNAGEMTTNNNYYFLSSRICVQLFSGTSFNSQNNTEN